MAGADRERQKALHVFKSSDGVHSTWSVVCSTCGWELHGHGDDTTQRDAEAIAHRCPPVDAGTT